MSKQIELSSSYSDDEIKRAAGIREWLVKLISDKHEELENLRATLSLVDSMLKLGSFKAASSLKDTYTLQSNPTNRVPPSVPHDNSSLHASKQTITSNIEDPDNPTAATDIVHRENQSGLTASDLSRSQTTETKELHRVRDNLLLAKAEFTTHFVDIVPAENILLSTNTAPFRSFFLGRILDGMKVKDEEKVRNLQIKESESLTYIVDENESNMIVKVRINNYRDKERLNEIFNTCAWVFSRMIEKGSR
jgi:light-regulated signal transduction histidine kinase (bacteriophytochrome)